MLYSSEVIDKKNGKNVLSMEDKRSENGTLLVYESRKKIAEVAIGMTQNLQSMSAYQIMIKALNPELLRIYFEKYYWSYSFNC